MAEKIYSIPIKEAFGQKCGCPLCSLRDKLEADELQRILGASMMEPDIRKETNRKGFCESHLNKMLAAGSRLPMALMLSTHLTEFAEKIDTKKLKERYEAAKKSCYLCARRNEHMSRLLDNLCFLYQTDESFRALFGEQEFFCKTHSLRLLEEAEKRLSKKERAEFCEQLGNCNRKYLAALREDIDWFCKKFDYRYEKEDWKNAKDAPERAVRFLS